MGELKFPIEVDPKENPAQSLALDLADEEPDHSEHTGEEGESWLISYADMMTLLVGFFVV